MDETKVWIYQANRELNSGETNTVKKESAVFLDDWTAHGKALKASIEIYYERFIVVTVDECQVMASGCSIDKVFHFIQELEKKISVDLLDRMQVAYKQGEKVLSCSLTEFEHLLGTGKLHENTIVFNNLVNTKADFDMKWEVPLKDSWHSRFLINK